MTVTLEQLRGQYREQILALAAQQGVENIRVFGSVARGDADEKSDVDLLVSLRSGATLWELAGLHWRLEDMLKTKVDLVADGQISPYMVEDITNEAVPL